VSRANRFGLEAGVGRRSCRRFSSNPPGPGGWGRIVEVQARARPRPAGRELAQLPGCRCDHAAAWAWGWIPFSHRGYTPLLPPRRTGCARPAPRATPLLAWGPRNTAAAAVRCPRSAASASGSGQPQLEAVGVAYASARATPATTCGGAQRAGAPPFAAGHVLRRRSSRSVGAPRQWARPQPSEPLAQRQAAPRTGPPTRAGPTSRAIALGKVHAHAHAPDSRRRSATQPLSISARMYLKPTVSHHLAAQPPGHSSIRSEPLTVLIPSPQAAGPGRVGRSAGAEHLGAARSGPVHHRRRCGSPRHAKTNAHCPGAPPAVEGAPLRSVLAEIGG